MRHLHLLGSSMPYAIQAPSALLFSYLWLPSHKSEERLLITAPFSRYTGETRKEEPMEDEQAVIAANQAFYRAFETLEIKEMEKVWLRASHIKCVHPGW